MISYIIQRLLQGVVVLFLVTFFTFALMQLAPGDGAAMAGRRGNG